jgi:hypothetical protein
MADADPKRERDERVAIPLDPHAAGGPLHGAEAPDDAVDEMERESFPASDPHSGWAGPPDS